MGDATALQAQVAQILCSYPDLAIHSARPIVGEGQFNHVLVINEQLVFRFPRTPMAAKTLVQEASVLARLQGRLPLPIPNPIYHVSDPETGALLSTGYPMLPGRPLWGEALAAISDAAALDRMASQLATFLRVLHMLPVDTVAPGLHVPDEATWWAELHTQFQARLYSFMRPDARRSVDALFAAIDDHLRRVPPAPALRHGDFGGGNILYDPETLMITGVLDFSFTGPGDPAVDIAALGEELVTRGLAVYPAMRQLLPRARLYRETFALQQALYAIQDGNQADFDDGMRAYV